MFRRSPRASFSAVLRIDDGPSGLRVRRAEGFGLRLIGFWPAPSAHAVDAVLFPRCSAVHTFGMLDTLDIVFLDARQRVLRVEHRARPWRMYREARASSVVELRAGFAAGLGIEPGSLIEIDVGGGVRGSAPTIVRRRASRRGGSVMIEFTLAAVLVMLPFISVVLELAQLATARHVLAIATADAARSVSIARMDANADWQASLSAIDSDELTVRLSLARGLLPVLGRSFDGAGDLAVGLERWRESAMETSRPDRLQVSVREGLVETADVRVGRLEVRYCRELFFAPARFFLPALLRTWDRDPFSRLCYEADRVPIAASAPMSESRFP